MILAFCSLHDPRLGITYVAEVRWFESAEAFKAHQKAFPTLEWSVVNLHDSDQYEILVKRSN